jgi:GMP synthase-like glutamine amidotransferase
MTIAILRTGRPPDGLAERFGQYEHMFAELLGPRFASVAYDVEGGALPARAEDHTAYLITGSPWGVYDPAPWIPPLEDFLRAAKNKAKLVGICFGHQIMAQAFGGRVEKSERGWGVGLQRYAVVGEAPFLGGEREIAVPVSHQDQIVVQPPASRIVAASDFSPYGVLAYTDQPALSMQFHPEFAPDFTKALIETRRGIVPDVDAAIASLEAPDDREAVAGWIRRFLAGRR